MDAEQAPLTAVPNPTAVLNRTVALPHHHACHSRQLGDRMITNGETWRRRGSAKSEQTIVDEIRALTIERYPIWAAQHWIERGVRCRCSEHAA